MPSEEEFCTLHLSRSLQQAASRTDGLKAITRTKTVGLINAAQDWQEITERHKKIRLFSVDFNNDNIDSKGTMYNDWC